MKFSRGSQTRVSLHVEEEPPAQVLLPPPSLPPRPVLRVDVADRGVGMTQAECERMFHPFEHAAPEKVRRPHVRCRTLLLRLAIAKLALPFLVFSGRRHGPGAARQPAVCVGDGRRHLGGQHAGRRLHVRAFCICCLRITAFACVRLSSLFHAPSIGLRCAFRCVPLPPARHALAVRLVLQALRPLT
jgi:hypothetical protein